MLFQVDRFLVGDAKPLCTTGASGWDTCYLVLLYREIDMLIEIVPMKITFLGTLFPSSSPRSLPP